MNRKSGNVEVSEENIMWKPEGLRTLLYPAILFLLLINFYACKDENDEYVFGEEFIESNSHLTLIDTFSVKLSSVIMDTLITSGTGVILCGTYDDPYTGRITSNSYFRLGRPDTTLSWPDEDDVYDSLKLVLTYNGYYYGDTTATQKFTVHRLNEKIELDNDNYIYNSTAFDYDPVSLGTREYLPVPNSSVDTLEVVLDDNLGVELLNQLLSESETVSSDNNFINYFKGLVLVTDKTRPGSIVGFSATEDDAKVVLYTHLPGETESEVEYEFPLTNTPYQYNNTIADFSGTVLSELTSQRKSLPSEDSQNYSFIRGGVGLMTKLEFPSLQELLLFDRGIIMEANLQIYPRNPGENNYNLPEELVMYLSDDANKWGSLVLSASSCNLTIDEVYREDTYYTFDMTDLIKGELSDDYFNPDNDAFLISLPYTETITTVDGLEFDMNFRHAVLNIYYLSY